MIKTVFFGLFLGATLGFTLAAEFFNRIGLPAESYLVVLGGLIIAALLVNRGIAIFAAVAVLAMAVLQPEQVLLAHGFDKDLLLATLLSIVLYPLVYRFMHS